jgi:fumarate hydratase class II
MSNAYRTEHDGMGDIEVPAEALWGAQTQRAVENFPVSGLRMPGAFIEALARIKQAAAAANRDLGLLGEERAEAIIAAARRVAEGEADAHFPVDVFQTGSGTSTNMNANEVIANLARRDGPGDIHPNDHVNMSQSSNDVIPSAIRVSAALTAENKLLPALRHLESTIEQRAGELTEVVKTGRTHLMDAMPLTLGQELGCWASQLRSGIGRIEDSLERLRRLPLGGTAIGTGVNAHPEFANRAAAELSRLTGLAFRAADNRFEGIAAQDDAVELSGQLKTLACSLMKIGNDLRLMNSGPLAGLGEIELTALQPGSSIMPGKVNPVIPEAVCMVAAQVIGNDAAITVAGQSGQFQLNVMLPLVAHNLLQSIGILTQASRLLADRAIRGFTVRGDTLERALQRNPVLVTALNRAIGYDHAAAIAKQAWREGRPVRDVALEQTDLPAEEIDRLLDPLALTRGGIPG